MAKLKRSSTNLDAKIESEGTTPILKVQLTFNFQAEEDFDKYVMEDGTVDHQALLLNFGKVMASVEKVNL